MSASGRERAEGFTAVAVAVTLTSPSERAEGFPAVAVSETAVVSSVSQLFV
jgi:hypothetical protein